MNASSTCEIADFMPHRYYCEHLDGSEIELSPTEAQHAVKVMRNREGDEIQLFDGRGSLADAEITSIQRRNVTVRVIQRHQIAELTEPEVVVAAAPPRGDRLKWMVEKLTELGATAFVPLETERSVTDPGAGKLNKLEATVISACKQCRRLRLMTIESPQPLKDVLRNDVTTFWLAHPDGSAAGFSSFDPDAPGFASHTIFIGPEGGFTDEEVQQIRERGAHLISWPGSILRIETAAITSLALLKGRLSVST